MAMERKLPVSGWERIGTHDLRLNADPHGGFYHVTLMDVDDADVIVVNEDDLVALRDRLSGVIAIIQKEATVTAALQGEATCQPKST